MPSLFSKTLPALLERYFFLCAALILGMAVYNGFYHLDAERVWDWDESLDGQTAYEMCVNHNYVVSTFLHQLIVPGWADQTAVWNYKPPLGFWGIVLGFKLFGYGVFGLRFYSALSFVLTVLLVLAGMARHVGRLPALLSATILATTSPMVFIHGARSGDFSPLFTLIVLLYLFLLLESETRPSFLYAAGAVFALGFLVYSFAAFQLAVLTLAFLAFPGPSRRYSVRHYAGALLCAVLPIAVWVVWRLANAEGLAFFKGMIDYDLVKRSTQSLEGHAASWDYYLVALAKSNPFWFVFTAATALAAAASTGFPVWRKDRPWAAALLGVAIPMALFSIAQTKIGWYTIPVHPPFAVATGCLAWFLFKDPRCKTAAKVVLGMLFIVALLRSEREIYKQIKNPAQETSQLVLMDLKKIQSFSGATIYSKGLTHATHFVAEVVCGLNPVTVKDPKECLGQQGYLMLEKDPKNTDSQDFAVTHNLPIVVQNGDWMILKL